MAEGVHAAPRGDKWAVKREGGQRASSLHGTQREAEKTGRQIARNDNTGFVSHGKQGRITERVSYGSDPGSSKG